MCIAVVTNTHTHARTHTHAHKHKHTHTHTHTNKHSYLSNALNMLIMSSISNARFMESRRPPVHRYMSDTVTLVSDKPSE